MTSNQFRANRASAKMALCTKFLLFLLAVNFAKIDGSQSNQSTIPLTRKPRYYFAMQDYLKPWNMTLESLVGQWKPLDRRTEKSKLKLQTKPKPLQITTPKPLPLESQSKSNCTGKLN